MTVLSLCVRITCDASDRVRLWTTLGSARAHHEPPTVNHLLLHVEPRDRACFVLTYNRARRALLALPSLCCAALARFDAQWLVLCQTLTLEPALRALKTLVQNAYSLSNTPTFREHGIPIARYRRAASELRAIFDAAMLNNIEYVAVRWKECLQNAVRIVELLACADDSLATALRMRCGLSQHCAANWLIPANPRIE